MKKTQCRSIAHIFFPSTAAAIAARDARCGFPGDDDYVDLRTVVRQGGGFAVAEEARHAGVAAEAGIGSAGLSVQRPYTAEA